MELVLQRVGDLLDGVVPLQQVPDFQSNRVETEANPLCDVEQDCPVCTGGFLYSWRDADVFKAEPALNIDLSAQASRPAQKIDRRQNIRLASMKWKKDLSSRDSDGNWPRHTFCPQVDARTI